MSGTDLAYGATRIFASPLLLLQKIALAWVSLPSFFLLFPPLSPPSPSPPFPSPSPLLTLPFPSYPRLGLVRT
eukprot:1943231-Rhodomonas_salina.2